MKLEQGLIVSAIAVSALLVGILPATAQTTTRCAEYTSDTTIRANVTVPRGEICELENVTVNGNVTVGRNADLIITSSTVNGNVLVERNAFADVFDTAVNGGVALQRAFGLAMLSSGAASSITSNNAEVLFIEDSDARSTFRANGGEVLLDGARMTGEVRTERTFATDVFDSVVYSDISITGAEAGAGLCGSEFDGLVSLVDNSQFLQIGSDGPLFAECGFNVMAADVEMLDNTAEIQVADNAIRGNVDCEGNDPAPMLGANRLRGEGTGQCAPAEAMAEASPDATARLFSSPDDVATDRRAEVDAKVEERRAAAGVDEPTVEEQEEAAETQAETRAAEAEAAPAAPPARVEGRALPPRSRG